MKRKKIKHLLKVAYQSRPLVILFSLVMSFLLIIGSTYSWLTHADERINRSNSGDSSISVSIKEKFTPNVNWVPGTDTEKEIQVENDGKNGAFVRLSLHEFFMGFEVDVTDNHSTGNGNGNLAVYSTLQGAEISRDDLDSWQVGNSCKAAADRYYKADFVILNATTDHSKAYQYGAARTNPLSEITINFDTANLYSAANPPSSGATDYWYYEDGYFYYSEILAPGELTTRVIKSVSLSTKVANQYKSAFYKLVPVMDGHAKNMNVLSNWGLTSGFVYNHYSALLND